MPQAKPLGEVTHPFDYVQLLRLEAEAIRETTQADIGIIAAHTPRYLRWSDHLPVGPVTLHDLAALDALPQYVSTGAMQGDDLAGRYRFEPAAWTVRAERRELGPGNGELALADLDPAKTYRVAIGYHGIHAYRAQPAKMERLFKFATQEDFLRDPHNGILIHDLAMTPIQVTEAVAQYIRKRGQVTPRISCYDLADYVMNPQVNQFGSCDWLHVGVETNRLDGLAFLRGVVVADFRAISGCVLQVVKGAVFAQSRQGVSVANRVSRHQPKPPSISEYMRSIGGGSSLRANIQVPNRPVWNRGPGYARNNGQPATYMENPAS